MLTVDNDNCWMKDSCSHADCDTFCLKHFKLDYLFDEALIPHEMRKKPEFYLYTNDPDEDVYDYLSSVSNNILEFVGSGKNLYLYSSQCGCGKTSWAIVLIQSYLNKIWYKSELTCRALFINVPQFLIALKENISNKSEYVEHIKKNILSADIVVWDDIATKAITSFEAENLLSFIDGRIFRGKSNIFTSNLDKDELKDAVGDRLYSRIFNASDAIQFKGLDKRKLKNQ